MPRIAKTLKAFKAILDKNELVVVDFSAPWCGPCKMITPKFNEWSKEYNTMSFVKIDIEVNSETAEEYDISSIPAIVFFKDGKRKKTIVGVQVNTIEKYLNKFK